MDLLPVLMFLKQPTSEEVALAFEKAAIEDAKIARTSWSLELEMAEEWAEWAKEIAKYWDDRVAKAKVIILEFDKFIKGDNET